MLSLSSNLTQSSLYSMKDEEYLLYRAREDRKVDIFASRSWLVTAQTIFPKNFNVQFQIYKIAKEEKNIEEAAVCLAALIEVFINDALLWVEIDAIMNALCESTRRQDQENNPILIDIFSKLDKETQKVLVTRASERTKDTSTYCSLLLLLTSRFPDSTAFNGLKLVDALLKAEKPTHGPLNPFRKKLIRELLPRLLKAEGLEVRPKVLHQLLTKSLEFYVAYLTASTKLLLEAELNIEDPWKELFALIRLIGWNLGWELAMEFDSVTNREAILGRIQAMVESGARLGAPKGDNGEDVREVLFTTVALFLHALMDYTRRLYPDFMKGEAMPCFPPSLTLVEAFVQPNTSQTPSSPPMKRLRLSFTEETSTPHITVSNVSGHSGDSGSSEVDLHGATVGSGRANPIQLSSKTMSQTLITAIKCWDLLNSYEQVRAEFVRLLEGLNISRWLIVFNIDVLIYEGRLTEAEREIRHTLSRSSVTVIGNPSITFLTLNLKLASILYALNKLSAAAECAAEVVEKLSSLSERGGSTSNLVCSTPMVPAPPLSPLHSHAKPPSHKRHLHLLALTKPQCLQFVCTLLIYALRHLVVSERNGDDLCLGHLIVLLQYEWPRFDNVFEEVLQIIKQKGGFAYQFFAPYVVTPDILEEFMYLSSTLGGNLRLDILPLPHNSKHQRMSTRGADRDSKLDFKLAMKRQMLRCVEPMEAIIIEFLTRQGPYLSHVFM